MQRPLVNQPTRRPTNKLKAAMVGPVVTELWGNIMAGIYPPVAGPETSIMIGMLAAFGLAYMIRDRANNE